MAKTFPETEQAIIHFDVEKLGKVAIHRIDGQKYYEDEAKRTLGDNPLFFAFIDDAILLAGGPGGLAALKDLIPAEATPGPLFRLEMAMSKLAPTVGNTDADRKAAAAAAKKVFSAAGSDRVRITVDGGKSLRAHFGMQPSVVRFLAEVDKLSRKNEKEKEKGE
jgi:hypothetical protein